MIISQYLPISTPWFIVNLFPINLFPHFFINPLNFLLITSIFYKIPSILSDPFILFKLIYLLKIYQIIITLPMSSIKSQSLFSSTKNINYQQDIKPNESTSSIFRSIFDHLTPKPKSIVIESLIDFNPNNFQPNRSITLMERAIMAGYREHSCISPFSNWAVCKNQGVSEEEDNQDQCDEQIPRVKSEGQVKEEPKSWEQNLQSEWLLNPPVQPKKIKNETKNIPKNYGKAIISFIQKYRPQIQKIARHLGVDYDTFLADLKQKKKSINTIADLRTLWSDYRYSKCMRVISGLFLRKYALSYIFSSRICTFTSHIKYRQRLYEAISSPEEFRHIKDY